MAKNIKSKDLTVKQKDDFISKINKIDDSGAELIYTLINVYDSKTDTDNKENVLPYEGVYDNNEVKFDIEKFPLKLKQILYKFITIHCEKMQEDEGIFRP